MAFDPRSKREHGLFLKSTSYLGLKIITSDISLSWRHHSVIEGNKAIMIFLELICNKSPIRFYDIRRKYLAIRY